MTIQISDGTTTVIPMMVLGYTSPQTSANIEHPILGRSFPDMTLTELGARKGTFTLLLADAAALAAARALHASAGVIVYTDSDVPMMNMTYVLAAGGSLTAELDPETRRRWTLAVDFQEVAP